VLLQSGSKTVSTAKFELKNLRKWHLGQKALAGRW